MYVCNFVLYWKLLVRYIIGFVWIYFIFFFNKEFLDDLKFEIDKYYCFKCGVGFEFYEESNFVMVVLFYKGEKLCDVS